MGCFGFKFEGFWVEGVRVLGFHVVGFWVWIQDAFRVWFYRSPSNTFPPGPKCSPAQGKWSWTASAGSDLQMA